MWWLASPPGLVRSRCHTPRKSCRVGSCLGTITLSWKLIGYQRDHQHRTLEVLAGLFQLLRGFLPKQIGPFRESVHSTAGTKKCQTTSSLSVHYGWWLTPAETRCRSIHHDIEKQNLDPIMMLMCFLSNHDFASCGTLNKTQERRCCKGKLVAL